MKYQIDCNLAMGDTILALDEDVRGFIQNVSCEDNRKETQFEKLKCNAGKMVWETHGPIFEADIEEIKHRTKKQYCQQVIQYFID